MHHSSNGLGSGASYGLTVSIFQINPNGLALGEEADCGAQNSLPALNLIRSTKLHLST